MNTCLIREENTQHIGGGMWSNLISAAASSPGSAERGGGTPPPKSHRCPGQPNWCRDTAQSYLDDGTLCRYEKRRYDSLPQGMLKEHKELKFCSPLVENLLTVGRLFLSLGHNVTRCQFGQFAAAEQQPYFQPLSFGTVECT